MLPSTLNRIWQRARKAIGRTEDRDRAIADALADLAAGTVMPLRTAPDRVARQPKPKGQEADLGP